MDFALYFARKVQVDIGGFIAVEAQEGLERNIVTVVIELAAAPRTDLVG